MPNPFEIVKKFEEAIAEYSGSRYAVATDSCSSAILLSLLYRNVSGKDVIIPSRTYPSIPCMIKHAGGNVIFENISWQGIYELRPWKILDGAKRFTKDMFVEGTLHCLSFHIKKHLPIGRGGMILTNNSEAVKWLKLARFDGREECSLHKQKEFKVLGYNCYMEPDHAARGLWLLAMTDDYNKDIGEDPPYPDLSKFNIYK